MPGPAVTFGRPKPAPTWPDLGDHDRRRAAIWWTTWDRDFPLPALLAKTQIQPITVGSRSFVFWYADDAGLLFEGSRIVGYAIQGGIRICGVALSRHLDRGNTKRNPTWRYGWGEQDDPEEDPWTARLPPLDKLVRETAKLVAANFPIGVT